MRLRAWYIPLFSISAMWFLSGCSSMHSPSNAGTSVPINPPTTFSGVFTWHNDNLRTGSNLGETVLNTANVNATNFGVRFSTAVDGQIYGQPLYVAQVKIAGQGTHNATYISTEHDSVYAIDADNGAVLWRTSFINPPNVAPVPAEDTGDTTDITPEIGITGTSVIDATTGTLFVVAKTKERGTNYVQRLHALDITSGREKLGGPVVIQTSVPGTGDASSGGTVRFDALHELQREALLLAGGSVYVAFASHGDVDPYHGWLLGYDASNLRPTLVYNTTPNGSEGGIWQSGAGPAIDSSGNIFFISGNGTFDANTGGVDLGQSFIKLSPQGKVLDFFTPLDQDALNGPDFDVGSAGLLLLPDQPGAHPHLGISGGKNATIYVLDRDHMGNFDPNNNNIVQTLPDIFPAGDVQGLFTAPVVWNDTVFFGAVGDTITAFSLSDGMLSTAPVMRSATGFAYPGAALAISAHGSDSGILWAIENTTDTGDQTNAVLHAYDAVTMNELCTIQLPDAAVKFVSPTIANGKVYVAGQSTLTMLSL